MPAALLRKKELCNVHGRPLSSYPILIFGEEPPTPTTLPPTREPSKIFWQPRDISGRPGRDRKKKKVCRSRLLLLREHLWASVNSSRMWAPPRILARLCSTHTPNGECQYRSLDPRFHVLHSQKIPDERKIPFFFLPLGSLCMCLRPSFAPLPPPPLRKREWGNLDPGFPPSFLDSNKSLWDFEQGGREMMGRGVYG